LIRHSTDELHGDDDANAVVFFEGIGRKIVCFVVNGDSGCLLLPGFFGVRKELIDFELHLRTKL
jgi:hypothetical protein